MGLVISVVLHRSNEITQLKSFFFFANNKLILRWGIPFRKAVSGSLNEMKRVFLSELMVLLYAGRKLVFKYIQNHSLFSTAANDLEIYLCYNSSFKFVNMELKSGLLTKCLCLDICSKLIHRCWCSFSFMSQKQIWLGIFIRKMC